MRDFSSGRSPMCNFSGPPIGNGRSFTSQGRPHRAKTPAHQTRCSHVWQSQKEAVVKDPGPLAGHTPVHVCTVGPEAFTWLSPYWETGRTLYSGSMLSTFPLLANPSSRSLRHRLHKVAGGFLSGLPWQCALMALTLSLCCFPAGEME